MLDNGASLSAQIFLLLPLIGAAVGWYVASRVAVSALASAPGATLSRGAAQCIPVLVVAMTAIVRHQPQIAVGVIFGSCVAALSLVLGVITFTSPPTQITTDARRRWGLILPAAMLVFLAGYQSQFTLLHALVLAVQGSMISLVWSERGIAEREAPSEPVPVRRAWIAPVQIVLSIALCVVAGAAAVFGAQNLLMNSSLPSMSIIAALLLGPALVIPMIGAEAALVQKGEYTEAASSIVAFALVGLCVLLPIVIVAWHVESALPIEHVGDLWRKIFAEPRENRLMFPLIVWRVDTVLLLVLGLALLPMSLGRWLPARAEGIVLILLYLAYMLLWRAGSAIA